MSIDARDARGVPDEGFHEIQLSGKQLVFLFMATTVVSIVIFLCGVLVGRGVRAEAVADSGAAGSAAAVERAEDEPLADTHAGPPRGDAVPPAPLEEPTPAESMSPGDLTYSGRLEATEPQKDELKPPRAARSETPAPPPAPAPAAKPPAVASAPAAATTAPLATAAPRDGRYVVQVAALRERSEAEVIARRLSSRGYEAYVDASSGSGVRMYRVRVGAFKERREADRVRVRLEREEQFKPWVTTR